ncbi:MAG TPA: hypothetical protein VFQ23_03015, partial [Anaerolineales bacterium]|nr:hypothetical protein [Anaerolineales bacterium]
KGLALSRQIPLISIPTLDILASAQPASKLPLAVLIQAGRGRYALGWYKSLKNRWQVTDPAKVITIQALLDEIKSPSIVCGEFTSEDRRLLEESQNVQLASPALSVRRPAVLGELAWERWQAGEVDDEATLAPIYLHTAEAISI